jgi:acyl-CoA thioester hydrolase
VLSYKTVVPVRFNEADPLGIVWHGHYIRYFEDGREAFGKEFGISYLDFHKQGIVVPIVSVQCDYKKPLRYGESIIIHTIYRPVAAAKLIFDYEITQAENNARVATGSTTQVFVDAKTFDLQLINPPFFEQWKTKWRV